MIFIDTDVLLDLAWNREPFSYAAADLLTLAERGQEEVGSTPVVLTNVYHLISAKNSNELASAFLLKLSKIIRFIPITGEDYIAGLKSKFRDKEDAINHFAAISASCTAMITRNKRDFTQSKIPVYTAEEYLETEWPNV